MPLSQKSIDTLNEHRERMKPRPFDLNDASELSRLLHETAGYARVSLHHGTDRPGREFASDALSLAVKLGYRLVPPTAS